MHGGAPAYERLTVTGPLGLDGDGILDSLPMPTLRTDLLPEIRNDNSRNTQPARNLNTRRGAQTRAVSPPAAAPADTTDESYGADDFGLNLPSYNPLLED
jgi:hypothetical protein